MASRGHWWHGQAPGLEGKKRRSFVLDAQGDTVELVATRWWGCHHGSKRDQTDAKRMGHNGLDASSKLMIFRSWKNEEKVSLLVFFPLSIPCCFLLEHTIPDTELKRSFIQPNITGSMCSCLSYFTFRT